MMTHSRAFAVFLSAFTTLVCAESARAQGQPVAAGVRIVPLPCMVVSTEGNQLSSPIIVELARGGGSVSVPCPPRSLGQGNPLTAVGVEVWTSADSEAAFNWLRDDVRTTINKAVTEKALEAPLVRSIKSELSNELLLEVRKLQAEVAELRKQLESSKATQPTNRPSNPRPGAR